MEFWIKNIFNMYYWNYAAQCIPLGCFHGFTYGNAWGSAKEGKQNLPLQCKPTLEKIYQNNII